MRPYPDALMTLERHAADLNRLNLERIRDLLFESRLILAELRRNQSQSVETHHDLEAEISALEVAPALEQALHLRSKARDAYQSGARASTAL